MSDMKMRWCACGRAATVRAILAPGHEAQEPAVYCERCSPPADTETVRLARQLPTEGEAVERVQVMLNEASDVAGDLVRLLRCAAHAQDYLDGDLDVGVDLRRTTDDARAVEARVDKALDVLSRLLRGAPDADTIGDARYHEAKDEGRIR